MYNSQEPEIKAPVIGSDQGINNKPPTMDSSQHLVINRPVTMDNIQTQETIKPVAMGSGQIQDIKATPVEEPILLTPAQEMMLKNPIPTVATVEVVEQPVAASTSGLIILQWLNYFLWGLTIFVTSILTVEIVANFMLKETDEYVTPYLIAALIILLPLSFICNLFYSKREPEQKIGGASIVMVIHAVLFGLYGTTTALAIGFTFMQMALSDGDTKYLQIALYSEIIVLFLYGAIFLRVINPAKPILRKLLPIITTGMVSILFLFGIFGPFAGILETQNDRLIDNNISNLSDAIGYYVEKNKKLPATLQDLDFSKYSDAAYSNKPDHYAGVKKLISKKIVKYTPNSFTEPSSNSKYSSSYSSSDDSYYYKLCVVYKEAANSYSSSDYLADSVTTPKAKKEDDNSIDEYSSNVSTYSHTKGDVCYRVSIGSYGSSYYDSSDYDYDYDSSDYDSSDYDYDSDF